MISRSMRLASATAIAAGVLAGCGSGLQTKPPAVAPAVPAEAAAPAPVAQPPAEDPILALIAVSQRHFEAGQQELSIGHLDRAREEFNKALDVLLRAPNGARTEPRLREHFDRLVDRISTCEVTALAQGDGFSEQATEPASIDALLELATQVPDAAPSAALSRLVASDLEATTHDIEIPLNARVLAYIELFQGKLRDWIASGLERGARYLPMIQDVFRAEGLPLDLAYIPLIESAFKPNAVSRAKARGVWQFMARTALAHGLKRDWYVDERSDPEKSTRAAAKYLQSLVRTFDGDWHLALASYNGGPGRVQRAMKRFNKNDFWSLAANPRALPRETREYVPMILAAIVIARNPVEYGFAAVTPPPDTLHETVRVTRPVDLRRIAEWTGTSTEAIQELNPELRRWTTPVRSPEYELKVPPGTAEILKARLEAADPAEMAALQWYTVKRGETLSSIARKLGVSRANLAEANHLSLRARVATGQQLIIPAAPTLLLASNADRPVPTAASRPVVPADAVPATAPASPEGSDRIRVVYQVKRGDTLSSLARQFRTSVGAIKRWNGLRSDRLQTGARLTVFAAARPES